MRNFRDTNRYAGTREYCETYLELTFHWCSVRQSAEPDVGYMTGFNEDITLEKITYGDKVIWEEGQPFTFAGIERALEDVSELQVAFDEENAE